MGILKVRIAQALLAMLVQACRSSRRAQNKSRCCLLRAAIYRPFSDVTPSHKRTMMPAREPDPEPVFQMPLEAEKVEVVPAGVIVIDSGIARGVEKSALGESAALNSRRKPMNKTMRKKRRRPYSFTFDRLGKTSRSPELAAPLDTVCGHVKVQTNAAVVDMLSTTNEAHTVA